MNRRGYGGLKLEVDTARMTLYGIDEEGFSVRGFHMGVSEN